MKSGDWQETRYDELRGQADALAERIRVLDGLLEAATSDDERRVIGEQLARLHREWDAAITKRDRIREGIPENHDAGNSPAANTIEHRVSALEHDVAWIKQLVQPGARRVAGKLIFYGLLIVAWSIWMIGEVRAWLLANPVQAIIITLALGLAALIVRWLPEDGSNDQR